MLQLKCGNLACSLTLLLFLWMSRGLAGSASGAELNSDSPVVEIEEEVYRYEPANNGAGPLWCSGSTCLVRIGDKIFASGLATLKDAQPLNNCRWLLFSRGPKGWELQQADQVGRTREPSPLTGFPDGRLFLSANPTLGQGVEPNGGPARPEILQFSAADAKAPFEPILPVWEGTPAFREHSYRSFAADGPNHELILFQNIDYTHAEWSFLDRTGKWSAQGKLRWPSDFEEAKAHPIRVCYPDVMLKDRAVHFCGVSDIVEPNPEWRKFKKDLTGREWDYAFRRLFYTWTPNVTAEKFRPWVEIANCDQTGGGISPGDIWVGPGGLVHILWSEHAIDDRLRTNYFPEARQSHALNYAVLQKGQVVYRRTIAMGGEGFSREIPSAGRFQITPDNRLFVIYYVQGTGADGQALSENRVLEIGADGKSSRAVKIPLKIPFNGYFTATVRGGSPPSDTVELLGQRAGSSGAMSYARIRLR